MKIYRKNGTIIEMTVEEYKTAFLKKSRDEFVEEYRNPEISIVKPEGFTYKEATTPYKEPSTPSKRTRIDMKEYMREYRKRAKVNATHKRKSSCKKWKRGEDKIIKENVDNLKKAKRLLNGRTLIAVYSRRQKLKEIGKIKDYKKIRRVNENDGRIKMMQYVNSLVTKLRMEHPSMDIRKLRHLAFDSYKAQKSKTN